ncbi:MAG: hypothetical protein P1U40_10370 [Coxiellaceae bacterium]|nr:hypothetical protein [Coxiellaceae bacterium]
MPRIDVIYPAGGTVQHQGVTIERMQQYLRWTFYCNALQAVADQHAVDVDALKAAIPFADQNVEELVEACYQYFVAAPFMLPSDEEVKAEPVAITTSQLKSVIERVTPTVNFEIFNQDRTRRRFGLCFAFAWVLSTMRTIKCDDWWLEVLSKLNAWDKDHPEQLTDAIWLDCRPEKVFTLQQLFERAIHYLVFALGSSLRLPGILAGNSRFGCIVMQTSSGLFDYSHQSQLFMIKSSDRYIQYFSEEELAQFLRDNMALAATEIVAIVSNRHACTLAYDLRASSEKPWLFYDSNYDDGRWHRFNDAMALAREIIARPFMGSTVSMAVMSCTKPDVKIKKPVLMEGQHYKRIHGGALSVMLKYLPETALSVLQAMTHTTENRQRLAEALVVTGSYGRPAFQGLCSKAKNAFCYVVELAKVQDGEHHIKRGIAAALLMRERGSDYYALSAVLQSFKMASALIDLAAYHDTPDDALKVSLQQVLAEIQQTHWYYIDLLAKDERVLSGLIRIYRHGDTLESRQLRQAFCTCLTSRKTMKWTCTPLGSRVGFEMGSWQRHYDSPLRVAKKRFGEPVIRALRELILQDDTDQMAFDVFRRRYLMLHCNRFMPRLTAPLLYALTTTHPRHSIGSMLELVSFLQHNHKQRRRVLPIIRQMVEREECQAIVIEHLPGI